MDSRITKSGDVLVVRWYDNNSVNVSSTFAGIGTTHVFNRWSTKKIHLSMLIEQRLSKSTMTSWAERA